MKSKNTHSSTQQRHFDEQAAEVIEDNLIVTPEPELKPKRMTVVLPPDNARALELLSSIQSITQNEAIRRAISTEAYIQNEVRKDSTIFLRTKEGETKELIFR